MSNFDFYKKKFQNYFSEKSSQSIMLTIVNLEIHVVTIRFFKKNRNITSRHFFENYLGIFKMPRHD